MEYDDDAYPSHFYLFSCWGFTLRKLTRNTSMVLYAAFSTHSSCCKQCFSRLDGECCCILICSVCCGGCFIIDACSAKSRLNFFFFRSWNPKDSFWVKTRRIALPWSVRIFFILFYWRRRNEIFNNQYLKKKIEGFFGHSLSSLCSLLQFPFWNVQELQML